MNADKIDTKQSIAKNLLSKLFDEISTEENKTFFTSYISTVFDDLFARYQMLLTIIPLTLFIQTVILLIILFLVVRRK